MAESTSTTGTPSAPNETPEEKRRRLNREKQHRYRLRHPDRVKAKVRDWLRAHKDELRERHRDKHNAWKRANREQVRKLNQKSKAKCYAADPERFRATARKSYHCNADQRRERSRVNYRELRTKLLSDNLLLATFIARRQPVVKRYSDKLKSQTAKDQADRRQDKVCLCCGASFKTHIRCKKYCSHRCTTYVRDQANKTFRGTRGATGPALSVTAWLRVMRYFDWRCVYCGCRPKKFHMDHLEPLARGGRHEEDNIVPACPQCNLRKGAMSMVEFLLLRPILGRIKRTKGRRRAVNPTSAAAYEQAPK